jgi:ParB-like nuclease domain
MEIKKVNIEICKPYWRNPRNNRDAVESVKNSIKEYGYNQLISVDKDMVIVTGHTRYIALVQLGYKEIEVIVLDLPAQKIKEYRIADNKTSEIATWNENQLIQELREIEDTPAIQQFFDESIEDMLQDSTGTTNFKPTSQEEINNTKESLDNHYKQNGEDLIDLMCPHCGKEYKVARKDL